MKRAERRLARATKIARAKRILALNGWGANGVHPAKWADNMAKCSCHMCCNERRNPHLTPKEKLTRQEKAADLAEKEMRRDL